MFCINCGQKLNIGSKYCASCGAETKAQGYGNEYPISKLTIMLVVTFGTYFLYWFERNWQLIKKERKSNIHPFLRTLGLLVPILNLFLIHEQFREISELAREKGVKDTYSPGWRLFWLFAIQMTGLSFLYPLVLGRVQSVFNGYWQEAEPGKTVKTRFSWKEILALLFFSGIYLLFFIGLMAPSEGGNTVTTDTVTEAPSAFYNQDEIASSVVNIFCPSMVEGEEGSGGSGTIITDEGIILTNSHIIPQDEEYINVDEDGCLVVLPDPTTGQPDEMFWADPVVLPDISDTYDLAYLFIREAFYDEENGEYRGTYPRSFPAFDDSARCDDESIKLGEKVTIFGYPTLSGGYSLTLTDGLVSSFPGEGLIVTSAKISEGNSGGLAVDEDGCMLGVPAMISYDETESLGVIISPDLISQFTDEVKEFLKE